MGDISLEGLATHIITSSLDISMEDKTWQKLGFKKRPKYGKIINWFRKDWKVTLEKELMTELIIIYLSFGVRSYSEVFAPQKIIQEVENQLDENYHNIKLWETLNFESNNDFLRFATEGIKSYYKVENDEWLSITVQRTNVNNIPDKKLRAIITVGLAELTTSLPNRKNQLT